MSKILYFLLLSYRLLHKDEFGSSRRVTIRALALELLGLLFIATGCGDSPTLTSPPAIAPTPVLTGTVSPVTSKVSATPPQKPIATISVAMPSGWQRRWLKGIPCRVPCYEGITPGVTTAEQAVDILKQNPLISRDNVRFSLPSQGENYGSVSWYWVISPPSLSTSADSYVPSAGFMTYSRASSSRIIHQISVTLQGYKLSEIIAAYGEPSHVIATNECCPMTPVIRFVYLSQGFLVKKEFQKATPTGPTPKVAPLSAELEVESPQFFASGLDGLIASNTFRGGGLDPLPVTIYLMKWEGFGKSFTYYCRELDDKATSCT